MQVPKEVDPAEDDSTLLDRARRGCAVSCATLHGRYMRLVHGTALSVCRPDEVDDLCQDVFLRAFERLGQLREARAFGPWLITMTKNLARDRHRTRARRPVETELDEATPARDLPDRELRQRVLACVRSLPEAYREPLILRLVEGLDGPEIARLTGKTNGSLRVNLHRGMQKLRTMLEKEGWP